MLTLRNLGAGLAMATVLASCGGTHEHKTRIVREWPADQISEVKLRGVNGRVKVQSDAGGKVSLVAEIHAKGRPAREAVNRGLIDTRIEGETLEIREKTLSKKVIEVVPFFNTGRLRISYLLKVPESTSVAVTTINGRIDSEGVSGFLDLETLNGPIGIVTPRAQIDAETVNGSIRAEFTEEFRGAQLRTVNGSIKLFVPAEASIDAQVDQVNGAFRTNIPVSVNSSPGSRESRGSINGGEFPLEISTVNGSVTLERREARPQDEPQKTEAAALTPNYH